MREKNHDSRIIISKYFGLINHRTQVLCIVSIICMTLISITVITVTAITMKFLGVIQKPTEY